MYIVLIIEHNGDVSPANLLIAIIFYVYGNLQQWSKGTSECAVPKSMQTRFLIVGDTDILRFALVSEQSCYERVVARVGQD
jgi:hypothetical protein